MNPILLLGLAAFASFTNAAKLPKHWITCKLNDPKRNQCLGKAINGAVSDVMDGIPSLGILPLDPLHLIRLELDSGSNKGPVAVNLTLIDVDFNGLRSSTVEDIDFNWEKGELKGTTVGSAPVILIGDYAINGKILLLPIVGRGKCNFTLTDVHMGIHSKGSFVQKNGKKHFHIDRMDINLQSTRVYIRLDNLFNGDKALGDNMNKFLDENWKEVFGAFRGTIQKGLGEAFREIANRLFDKVPFDQIAPPN